jgi:membrane protein implicated in regulation of membrane protease activity
VAAYLILGVVGLVVLATSLVVGDVLDGVLDGVGGDWFSTEVVGGFVSALGFGGAIAVSAGAPGPVAVAVGLAVGTAFGWMAARFTRLVRGAGTDGTPAAGDVVGHEAIVLSDIPDEGLGTVRVHVGGHTLRYHASADLAIAAGTKVHVTSVLSPTAVAVAPMWSELPPPD